MLLAIDVPGRSVLFLVDLLFLAGVQLAAIRLAVRGYLFADSLLLLFSARRFAGCHLPAFDALGDCGPVGSPAAVPLCYCHRGRCWHGARFFVSPASIARSLRRWRCDPADSPCARLPSVWVFRGRRSLSALRQRLRATREFPLQNRALIKGTRDTQEFQHDSLGEEYEIQLDEVERPACRDFARWRRGRSGGPYSPNAQLFQIGEAIWLLLTVLEFYSDREMHGRWLTVQVRRFIFPLFHRNLGGFTQEDGP